MRMSVGVDLHKKQFTVYWRIEGEPQHGEYDRFLISQDGYREFERKLLSAASFVDSISVAVESTGNTRYFKNRVETLGIAVVVVNTLKFKVVNESVKKTDRHDASTLAEFLEKEMLPVSRLCSQHSEELRRLVKARGSLVKTIVAVKNQIHGLLLSLGIESKRGELQSKKERRRVQNVLAAQQLADAAVDPLFETIDRLNAEVKKLETVMEALVKDDPVVALIRTIPGAGLITATTIRAYVDDIGRFESPKQLAAYAGLTPWVQNSAERERHGRITKRGPNELRTALVQVVLGMVRNKRRTGAYRMMLQYSRMKPQKGSGRTIIATARKLSEIIWHMLHEGRPFDEARMMSPEIRQKAMEMQAAALDAA
jgi:transposase